MLLSECVYYVCSASGREDIWAGLPGLVGRASLHVTTWSLGPSASLRDNKQSLTGKSKQWSLCSAELDDQCCGLDWLKSKESALQICAICRFVHLSSNLPLQFREFGFSLWVQHSPANYTFGRLDKLDKLQLWILFAAMLFLKIDFCTWRKCAVWWWLGFQPPSLLKLLIGASDWTSTHNLLVFLSVVAHWSQSPAHL